MRQFIIALGCTLNVWSVTWIRNPLRKYVFKLQETFWSVVKVVISLKTVAETFPERSEQRDLLFPKTATMEMKVCHGAGVFSIEQDKSSPMFSNSAPAMVSLHELSPYSPHCWDYLIIIFLAVRPLWVVIIQVISPIRLLKTRVS